MKTADRIATALRAIAPGGLLSLEDIPCIDQLAARWDARRPAHSLADKAAFFSKLRDITGSLTQKQVDTVQGLLSAAAHWPVSWIAYGLATGWHEARLEPIEEWGKGKGRPYAKPGKYGQPQYGRGLVQLTWDRNYEWADKELGLNGKLLADFSLALDPTVATQILVKGMESGGFTGKKLADYLKTRIGTVGDFTDARRIINGTDRAAAIGLLAVKMQDALIAGGWA